MAANKGTVALLEQIKSMGEDDLFALLKKEMRSSEPRRYLMDRIYARASVLRSKRERAEMGAVLV